MAMLPQTYNNGVFALQAVVANASPYFRAADVAKQLGYANGPQAVRKNVRDKFVTTLGQLMGVAPEGGGTSPGEMGYLHYRYPPTATYTSPNRAYTR